MLREISSKFSKYGTYDPGTNAVEISHPKQNLMGGKG